MLPKRLKRFLNYSIDAGNKINLLNKAINLNNIIRSQYNKLTEREIEQNINFFNGEKDS